MEIFSLKVCSHDLSLSVKEHDPLEAAAPLFRRGYDVVCLQGNFGKDLFGTERKSTVVLNTESPASSGGYRLAAGWNAAAISFVRSAMEQSFWVASFREDASDDEAKIGRSLKNKLWFYCSDEKLPGIQIAGVHAQSGEPEVPSDFTVHRAQHNVLEFSVDEGLCEKIGRLFAQIWSATTYLFRPEITCEFGKAHYDEDAIFDFFYPPLAMIVMFTRESRISLIWQNFLGRLYRYGLLSPSRLPASWIWKEHVRPRILAQLQLVEAKRAQPFNITDEVSRLTLEVLKTANQSVVGNVQALYEQDVVIASYLPRIVELN